MARLFIVFLLILIGASRAFADDSPEGAQGAQTATAEVPLGQVSGSVLERGTRTPLAGVLVTLVRGREAFEALTDERGQFIFYDLGEGSWSLKAELAGFVLMQSDELVRGGEETVVALYLERSADNPYDVLVEGKSVSREVTRRRLSARESQTLPGTFGDPLLAVENLPSVAVVPFAGGSISMRGAATDESSIYLDGLRVPFFFHFIGIRSMIAPGLLESMDLYPGGAPVNYGRQTGGVLSVNLKRSMPERLHGYLDVSLLDAGLFIEAPVSDEVAIAGAARFSYLDKALQGADAPIPRYDDYQLMLTARPGSGHQLRALFLGSDDSVRLDTQDLREKNAQITYGQLAAEVHLQHAAFEHEYTPSLRVQNRARVGYTHFTFETSSGELTAQASYNGFLVRDVFRYTPATWITAELGLDLELGFYNADVVDVPTPKEGEPRGYVDISADRRSLDQPFESLAAGGFVQLELRPTDRLTVVPGVRVDRQGQVKGVTVDPRIMARYSLLDQLALKAGTGVHHGPPAGDEVTPGFGNPNIGNERALHHSAGVELSPLAFLHFDLTGFYHQLDRISVPSDRVEVEDGQSVPLLYENTGEGRAYGLEMMLRHDLAHRLSGWVAYTLARAERRPNDSEPYRLFDFDQTHTLALVAAYQLPWQMQLSTRFRYRTGRPTTPVTGATFVSNTDTYAPTFGETNSARLPDFHQLDLRLDKRWLFDRWSFTGYVDVQNVYNRNNATDLTYSYDYRQRDKVQGLPVVAIVGFKAEY